MICAECGCFMEEITVDFEAISLLAGAFRIPDIKQWQCHSVQCDCVVIDFEVAKYIEQCIDKKEADLINSLPIGDFVTGIEAAAILGITKQAFSKNRRIKNGFIISKKMEGRVFYYRPSVIVFSGPSRDGRILLINSMESTDSSSTYSTAENSTAFSAGEDSYSYAIA